MKATELNLKEVSYNMLSVRKRQEPAIIALGRCLPVNKSQAKKVQHLDVLNAKDVEAIETIMNKHGFEGMYKYTTSKTWVRLQNFDDFKKALKLEFQYS